MDAVKVLSYLLAAVLLLSATSQFMVAVINPEAYCCGAKLSGWLHEFVPMVGITFIF